MVLSASSAGVIAVLATYVWVRSALTAIQRLPRPSLGLGSLAHDQPACPAAPGRRTVAVQTSRHAGHGSWRCWQFLVDNGCNRRMVRAPQSSKGLQASFLSRCVIWYTQPFPTSHGSTIHQPCTSPIGTPEGKEIMHNLQRYFHRPLIHLSAPTVCMFPHKLETSELSTLQMS